MTPKMKQTLMIAGFALLAVLAVAGWTRNPSPASAMANSFQAPGTYIANDMNRAVYGQGTTAQQPYAQTYGQQQPAYGQPAYGQPYAQPVYAQNCAEPLPVHSAAYAPAGSQYYEQTRYRTYSRPRVVRTVVADRDYVVRKKRSTGKSVAIVAGSAGAGAAIGALAGGGKGAAIGGLTGGVAGFVYDRLTHNR